MKIKKIKINAFGGLTDKEIELEDNINIIYGKNEAGKSTLLKFITNIFYGTSKNKKGRYASDYDMYKPWNTEEFSGKVNYELDNGESFEVYREFGKKNPKIYNSNLEEISKQFNIDKNLGNQFFYDQTKVDEEMFLSTSVSMQQEVKLDTQSQNVLVQKIANLAGTGDDNVSYKKAIDKLSKKQTDDIGTARTLGKPINIATQKINKLKNEKEELGKYKNLKYEFEENKNTIEDDIEKLEWQNEYLKNIKIIMQNQKLEQEKIEYNKTLIKRNDEKIEKINAEILAEQENFKNEKNKINNNEKNKMEKINNKLYLIIFSMLILINIFSFLLIKNVIVNITTISLMLILVCIYIINKNKIQKNNKKIEENTKNISEKINLEIKNKINSKNTELEILEKNNEEICNEIEKSENKINSEINLEKEKNKNKFINKIEINSFENLEYPTINFKIEKINQEINDKKLELHRMDLNKENIIPKLDNLSRIEEELENSEEEYKELLKKNEEINLAKEFLIRAYEKMKNNVTPRFTQKLSDNLSKFSNNKYNKVVINDESGLMVELPTGEYVSAEQLSLGTIDQLYLALRLSMVNEIAEEKMPIILDEAFAFFDEERLKNVLKYLCDNYANRQIMIFTCTTREENTLNELNKNYKKIILPN